MTRTELNSPLISTMITMKYTPTALRIWTGWEEVSNNPHISSKTSNPVNQT